MKTDYYQYLMNYGMVHQGPTLPANEVRAYLHWDPSTEPPTLLEYHRYSDMANRVNLPDFILLEGEIRHRYGSGLDTLYRKVF